VKYITLQLGGNSWSCIAIFPAFVFAFATLKCERALKHRFRLLD